MSRAARLLPAAGSNGNGGAASAVVRRPCTLPAAVRADSNESPVTHCAPHARTDSASDSGGRGTATSASRGAMSSANPPPPSGTNGSTRCATPPSSCARAEAAARSRPPPPTVAAVVSNAAYTVRQPVHRQRCAASARSSAGRRAAAARITIPGVQNPHCDPPVATNAAAIASRASGSSPSIVVTDRSATRAAAVTHATLASPSTSTVQQPHWPCGAQPSFTETRPSRSRRTDSSDSPGSTATSTPLPLQVNVTRSVTRTSGSAG